jgi:hypothetical protein
MTVDELKKQWEEDSKSQEYAADFAHKFMPLLYDLLDDVERRVKENFAGNYFLDALATRIEDQSNGKE